MMTVQILAFGIAKEIFGGQVIGVNLDGGTNVAALKAQLEQQYPRLKQIASYMVAVNSEYADGSIVLTATDEIAIIPPVSGG